MLVIPIKTFQELKKQCVEYAQFEAKDVDVKNDVDWQLGKAHNIYEIIKNKIHVFEGKYGVLSVDEYADVIEAVCEVLGI